MKETKEPSNTSSQLSSSEDAEHRGEDNLLDGDDLLIDEDNDDILFDKAEVIAPNEMVDIIERVTESGSAWPAENFSRWAYLTPPFEQVAVEDVSAKPLLDSPPHLPTALADPVTLEKHQIPSADMAEIPKQTPATALRSVMEIPIENISTTNRSGNPGLMDTVVEDNPAALEQLLAQQSMLESATSAASQPNDALDSHRTALARVSRTAHPETPETSGTNGSSGHFLASSPNLSQTFYREISSPSLDKTLVSGSHSAMPVASSLDKTIPTASAQDHLQVLVPIRDPNPLSGADFDVGAVIENSGAFAFLDSMEESRSSANVPKKSASSLSSQTANPQEMVGLPAMSSPSSVGSGSRSSANISTKPPVASPWNMDEEEPALHGPETPSASQDDVAGYETLPLHAMNQEARSDIGQRSGMGSKYMQQFEHVIDALSREGTGSREEIRESLKQITLVHYELLHSTGVDLESAYLHRIAEEQEAVWEQLCAHVDLYKDFLYQSLTELEQWRLSDDCCPNLLCRAPREKGQSQCRRCQSEFFLLCPSCKTQTPYFSDRCQQIQCGKPIPPDEKLNAAVKITNAYAQRQGKATVAAAAAFVLYYLMERFSITTRGDWFDQIDRYRKLQGKVNQEYQRRCLAAYQDELTRILGPAYDRMRRETFRQVGELYSESRYLDSLETLNAMPSVLRNQEVEEIRHRIYERLTEGELDHIEHLIRSEQLEEATRLLQELAFESPRRQLLVERCRHILQDKKQQIRAQQRETWGHGLFLLCLVAGAILHWMAMPTFLGKESWGWLSPYLLLLLSGGWLLRRRTVDVARAQWLLGQTVSMVALFGGILFVLLGLLFCSWYLTASGMDGSTSLVAGYRLISSQARVLSAYSSWNIVFQVSVVGGLLGLFAGAVVGIVLAVGDVRRRNIVWSMVAGALGVSLGVALISAVGITLGSALSVLVVNSFAAAVIVASITAVMVSVGVEVGLKVAADMALRRPVWGGVWGAVVGAAIGALFGAGIVHNGLSPKMKLIHPDVAWAGLPLAIGMVGAVLFVMVMLTSQGTRLRTLRWGGVLVLLGGSLLSWWGLNL